MREAKFILPDAAGFQAVEYARQALINCFGGYTVVQTSGAWQAPNGDIITETGRMFIVAIGDAAINDSAVLAIACEAARKGSQQAVYVVSSTGEATIHDIQPVMTDRIVRPDPEAALTPHQQSIMHRPDKNNGENLPVQEGDLWLTADDSLVRITNRKMSGMAYGMIIESDNEFAAGSTIVYEAHSGKYELMVDGPYPMHLKKLLHRR